MHAAKVVVHEVKSQSRDVVLDLLAECGSNLEKMFLVKHKSHFNFEHCGVESAHLPGRS